MAPLFFFLHIGIVRNKQKAQVSAETVEKVLRTYLLIELPFLVLLLFSL